VTAPLEERIERLSKRQDLPYAEAASRLEREQTARRQFVERSFRVEPDDPSLYDLAVNTGTLGVDGAAVQICTALQRS
jgi:cytidylate kinase